MQRQKSHNPLVIHPSLSFSTNICFHRSAPLLFPSLSSGYCVLCKVRNTAQSLWIAVRPGAVRPKLQTRPPLSRLNFIFKYCMEIIKGFCVQVVSRKFDYISPNTCKFLQNILMNQPPECWTRHTSPMTYINQSKTSLMCNIHEHLLYFIALKNINLRRKHISYWSVNSLSSVSTDPNCFWKISVKQPVCVTERELPVDSQLVMISVEWSKLGWTVNKITWARTRTYTQ